MTQEMMLGIGLALLGIMAVALIAIAVAVSRLVGLFTEMNQNTVKSRQDTTAAPGELNGPDGADPEVLAAVTAVLAAIMPGANITSIRMVG